MVAAKVVLRGRNEEERGMQFGLIALGPAGGIATLSRVAFGVVILFLAVPVLRAMWSLRTRRSLSEDSPDLDALWKRYTRGEISWDEYARAEVSGRVRDAEPYL
jgi:uncharacterized membrane protein